MNRISLKLLLLLTFAGPLQAGGGLPEMIFDSSFEGIEACIDFNGFNDAVLVPVIAISGDFSLNDGAFPADEFDDAVISLRDRATGDIFELGNTHDQSYTANIVPGHYDLMYRVESPGDNVPRNVGAVLMEEVVLLADGTLDIPVTSFILSGILLLNGGAFPNNEFDDGQIHLQSETAGTLLLGQTKFQLYAQVPVLPGDYEVRYKVETPGNTVPYNEWGLVGAITVVEDDSGMDIDVPSVALSGSMRHNGVLLPMVEYDDGNFYLETADGDRAFLDNSHFQNFQRNVMPGTYDVYWELETPGGTVPFNPRARIASDVDVSAGVLNIDMTSYNLAGDFLQNGAPFPNSVQHTGWVILRDQATGIDNILEQTHVGAYDHQVLTASYDIVYQHGQGDQVPENEDAVLGSVVVNSDEMLDIDVPATFFSVPVFHNGDLFTNDQQQFANIFLRDRSSADSVLLGKTSQQTVTARVIPGLYDIYYSHQIGDQIPLNTMARVHDDLLIEIPPALDGVSGGGFELHVKSIPITGQMLLNDAPMPVSEFDDGEITLKRASDSVLLGNTHDQSYNVRIIDREEPTLYQVFYGVETLGDSVPSNGNANVMCIILDPVPL
jgi:hypothetical protein